MTDQTRREMVAQAIHARFCPGGDGPLATHFCSATCNHTADALMPLLDGWLAEERAATTARVKAVLAEFDHDYRPPCRTVEPEERCMVCKVRAAMDEGVPVRDIAARVEAVLRLLGDDHLTPVARQQIEKVLEGEA